jgi:hypothetical protein
MLLPVATLLRRFRGEPGRAKDVADLHARFKAAARAPATDEARALAMELRALRPKVLEAFAGARACGGCARGRPLPHGKWNGGFCCGGATAGVFDDDEVAALALAGTRPRHLKAPAGGSEQAGCAFRGPQGCSLSAEDRPNLCVRFACRELEAELKASGDWERVRGLTKQLEQGFARFTRLAGG